LPTSVETVLLDTSAALALIQQDHRFHDQIFVAVVSRRRGLAGHAWFETYSVLTRLPPPHRLSAADAAHILNGNFPATHFLSAELAAGLTATFPTAGVTGGSVYDGLVAAAALDAGLTLVSCDGRAAGTYAALGARVELVR
jgi:hypothetical protein